MNLLHHALIACTLLSLQPSGLLAGNSPVSWQTPANSVILNSSGSPLTGDYIFELGGFKNNFTPSATNTADWAANWKAVGRANYNAVAKRIDAGAVLNNNLDPFELGDRVYVWGYNLTSPSAQWVLISKPVGTMPWVWPDTDNPFIPSSPNYSVTPAETGYVVPLGQVNAGNPATLIQTANVENAAPPKYPFALWVSSNFTATQQMDASLIAATADPDGDGLTNFYEYATGANPNVRTADMALSLANVSASGSQFAQLTMKSNSQAEATIKIQESTSLLNFVDLNPLPLLVQSAPGLLVLRDSSSISAATPRNFYRLQVNPAP